MADGIVVADSGIGSMAVANATVRDDAEFVECELASDPRVENHDLREWSDG